MTPTVIDKIGKFTVLDTLGAGPTAAFYTSAAKRTRKSTPSSSSPSTTRPTASSSNRPGTNSASARCSITRTLVKVYALETETGWFSGTKKAKLLLEYVPGRTMDQIPIVRMPKLIRVFERIADGLTHMHKQGVYHADLKPNNLIYDGGTRIKVIDFGLSWIRGEGKDRVQGTPEYMAPETVEHKLVSERTDIYNFGATMYRLTTLQLPPNWVSDGTTLPMTKPLFKQQLKPARSINPLIPEGLAELIHTCLQPNALKRPERMSHVQGTLDQLADEAAAKMSDPGELDD